MERFGHLLRKARKQKGVSLEEASAATKIKVEYLGALEEERFYDLPSDTYARGFLRIYARYLSLESEPLLQAYSELYQPSRPRLILAGQRPTPYLPLIAGIKWKILLLTVGGVLIGSLILYGVINLIRGGKGVPRNEHRFFLIQNPYTPGTIGKIQLPEANDHSSRFSLIQKGIRVDD